MSIEKLNIQAKVDNAAKKKMVQSNEIGVNETLMANEVNALVTKTNELVDAYNFGAPITAFNFKTNVPTYADLPTEGNEINDGYGVIEDGLVYVWNGTAFPDKGNGINLGLQPIGKVKKGNVFGVSGNEVAISAVLPNDIGIDRILPAVNIISDLVKEDINNPDVFGSGYLNSSGNVMTASNYVYTKEFVEIKSGLANLGLSIASNARVVLYDSELKVIQTIQKVSGDPPGQFWTKQFEFIEGAEFAKFSFYKNQEILEQCFVKFLEGAEKITDKVFLPTNGFTDLKTANKLNSWGKFYYTPDSNFLDDLTKSDFEDPEIWEDNKFLYTNGSEGTSSGYKYSKKYYKCSEGTLFLDTYFTGNAAIVFYDIDKNVLGGFRNPQGAGQPHYVGDIISPKGTVYCRVSYPDYYANTQLRNLKINPVDFTEIDTKSSKNGVSKSDIKRSLRFSYPMPIISFISDDGYSANKDWYVPILDEFGIKSTFAIITNSVGKPNFLTKEEILQLHEAGHDIAGHTHTHPMLGNQTPERVREELFKNSTILRSWRNDLKTRMFVAPYGSTNVAVDAEIANYYDADFITNVTFSEVQAGGGMNLPPLNRYRIRRLGFDTSQPDTSRYAILTQAVDNLMTSGGWLILTIHPHYEEYTQPNSVDRHQELRDLLSYIRSKDIQIMTAQQAFDIYQNRYEAGNELINPNDYYAVGMDGSEKGFF